MKWIKFLIGNHLNLPIDVRLMIIVSLTGAIMSIIAILINLFLHLGFWIQLFVILGACILFIIFLLFRFATYRPAYKWVSIFTGIALIDTLWFTNNGSHGPISYLFVMVFVLILFVWRGWPLYIAIVLFFLNFFTLFYIEYQFPNLIEPYHDNKTRLLDFYLSFSIYLGMICALVLFAQYIYVKEKNLARRADELKSAFLANMSHEIRTPMNAIIGFARLLKKKNLSNEKQIKYLELIQNSGIYLLELLNDILDFSKLEAGQLELEYSDVNVDTLFDELKATYDQVLEKYEKHHISFNCVNPTPNLIFRTDSTRIKQVLNNLLMNAIKFTDAGSIELGCEVKGEMACFWVKDTGVGIEERNLDTVFERFVKIEGKPFNRIHRGAGLGLSISKFLTEMLGGKIWVESTLGLGSKFQFTLPLKLNRIISLTPTMEKSIIDTFEYQTKKLLVVEDEENNFLLIKEYLDSSPIQITRAHDGNEALSFIQNQKFDLILMDITLTDISGIEILHQIRSNGINIPIIAQTACAMQVDAEKLITEGFTDCITKPIEEIKFLYKITQYL